MPNVKNIDFGKMFFDIGNMCMTENVCGKCQGKGCFVGYARELIGEGRREDKDTIPGGYESIPHTDVKGGYDKVFTLDAIAHTLLQCKSCKENHYDDCLVNIVRSCYEIIAFGDGQSYEGSTFQYLIALQEKYPEAALHISEIYKNPNNEDE